MLIDKLRVFCNKILVATFLSFYFMGLVPGNCGEYGSFVGDPEGKLVGADRFELSNHFDYVDPKGFVWRASKGFQSDGASIPWAFWSFIGSPFTGYYRYAAIIHDYFCEKKYYDSDVVHLNFYNGLLAKGVGKAKAQIMYRAVYIFGSGCRWERKISDLPEACRPGNKYDPSKCIHNSADLTGMDLGPRKKLNKENLEEFIGEMKQLGYSEEIDELRRQRAIQDILK